jgi:hypothetical protein
MATWDSSQTSHIVSLVSLLPPNVPHQYHVPHHCPWTISCLLSPNVPHQSHVPHHCPTSFYLIGCSNGGGGGNISEVKQWVAKWTVTRKRLFSVFLAPPVGFKKRRTFSRRHIVHVPINLPMHICLCSWALGICKKHWDSDIFWLGDGRICEGFSPNCVLAPWIWTRHFFYCTYQLHFLSRIFETNEKSSQLWT